MRRIERKPFGSRQTERQQRGFAPDFRPSDSRIPSSLNSYAIRWPLTKRNPPAFAGAGSNPLPEGEGELKDPAAIRACPCRQIRISLHWIEGSQIRGSGESIGPFLAMLPSVKPECQLTGLNHEKPSPPPRGEMAEWTKAPVSKTGVWVTVPWVRIPLSPPLYFPTPSHIVSLSPILYLHL